MDIMQFEEMILDIDAEKIYTDMYMEESKSSPIDAIKSFGKKKSKTDNKSDKNKDSLIKSIFNGVKALIAKIIALFKKIGDKLTGRNKNDTIMADYDYKLAANSASGVAKHIKTISGIIISGAFTINNIAKAVDNIGRLSGTIDDFKRKLYNKTHGIPTKVKTYTISRSLLYKSIITINESIDALYAKNILSNSNKSDNAIISKIKSLLVKFRTLLAKFLNMISSLLTKMHNNLLDKYVTSAKNYSKYDDEYPDEDTIDDHANKIKTSVAYRSVSVSDTDVNLGDNKKDMYLVSKRANPNRNDAGDRHNNRVTKYSNKYDKKYNKK